jgi:cytochrome c oxidase assembly protein subunit 15
VPAVSPDRFQRVAVAAFVTLATIVVTGAAVRLTDSGLGCPDWPTCEYGRLVPEWSFHGWIEFGNRLFSLVVVASVVAAALAARWRRPYRPELMWLSLGLVAGVLAQVVLGGVTVLVELHPAAVKGHFLLSSVLLANAVVLLDRAGNPGPGRGGGPLVAHSRLVVVLAALVLVTGTVVTGTGPHGGDTRAERWPLELYWVVRVHTAAAWVFVAALVALAVRVALRGDRRVLARTQLLVAVATAQGGVGYLQWALAVPPGLVALHVAGSVLVWCGALWVHLQVRRAPLLAHWVDARPPPARPPVALAEVD